MTDYRTYIFAQGNDAERQQLQFLALKPSFTQAIQHVLDRYELAKALDEDEVEQHGPPIDILEFGSGEGLYLHQVAQTIEAVRAASNPSRSLLNNARLYGVESTSAAVATADEYKLLSKPPRPYLNFYWHDLDRPLNECAGLKASLRALPGSAKIRQVTASAVLGGSLSDLEQPQSASTSPFQTSRPAASSPQVANGAVAQEQKHTNGSGIQLDFIYAVTILIHLQEARERLRELYAALKPGGVIYIREIVLFGPAEDWLPLHPFTDELAKLLYGAIAARNNGQDIATLFGQWLGEFGAEEVEEQRVVVPMGGDTEEGRYMLRQSLLTFASLKPMVVGSGLMSEQSFEQGWQALYRELSSKVTSQIVYRDSFARKRV